jgi:hypothetical protein
MGVHLLLITVLQMVLTGGVGGVLVASYALSGILLSERPASPTPSFASDYEELMWLAERQRFHVDKQETRRFFQLRQRWPEMHSYRVLG